MDARHHRRLLPQLPLRPVASPLVRVRVRFLRDRRRLRSLTRGGGADKTLRVFNETPLCRVIAGTDTPIVVGVGHEDDHTLADEVADRRVMTPTHAGEIVPDRAAKEREFRELESSLDTAYDSTIETQLASFATALDNAYRTTATTRLQEFDTALTHATQRRVETELLSLETRLDSAYNAVEQKKEHEEKLAETVDTVREEASADARAELETTRRRYRLIVIALTLLAALIILLYLL